MPDPPNQVIYPFTNLEKFDHKHSNFLVFKERLEQSFIVNNIKDGGQKRAILLCSLNEECYILLRNLCTPRLPETKPYEDLVTILTDFFLPVKSLFAERLKFYTAQQEANECVSDWLARVKSLVANCDFGDELQVVMRDIFTIGLNKTLVREKCFEEDPSLPATNLAKMAKTALSKEAALNEKHGSQDHPGITVKTEPVHYNQQRNRASGHILGRICSHSRQRQPPAAAVGQIIRYPEHQVRQVDIGERGIDLDDNGNVKPSYVKLLVENVPISFEADSGFAHAAISERLYLKYFKGKTLCANDLALKDYIVILPCPSNPVNQEHDVSVPEVVSVNGERYASVPSGDTRLETENNDNSVAKTLRRRSQIKAPDRYQAT
ncbi:hypothetical protein NQ317_017545 [Molorchus minor]|uniref:Uncharacterized protein n=1 Tax=Molorchus minor TaxID=1323400 RepID=A0ABQ9IQU1_9CUCU|nr:hypothetical protein NQ317_017545 [Molorchus minor]